jgi:hypothetical protein
MNRISVRFQALTALLRIRSFGTQTPRLALTFSRLSLPTYQTTRHYVPNRTFKSANIEPHSGSQTNQATFASLLIPDEKMLGYHRVAVVMCSLFYCSNVHQEIWLIMQVHLNLWVNMILYCYGKDTVIKIAPPPNIAISRRFRKIAKSDYWLRHVRLFVCMELDSH